MILPLLTTINSYAVTATCMFIKNVSAVVNIYTANTVENQHTLNVSTCALHFLECKYMCTAIS